MVVANCILGPGSFLEATKLIPLLVKGDDGPAFDVVVPSLPNYGFSQGVQKVCSLIWCLSPLAVYQ